MAVSQKQIAERVGVSIALVSRVLSGRARDEGIADGTIEKVMKAAEEMGYVPRAAALTLKGKSSNTTGVVVYDFKDPFFAAMIEELQSSDLVVWINSVPETICRTNIGFRHHVSVQPRAESNAFFRLELEEQP